MPNVEQPRDTPRYRLSCKQICCTWSGLPDIDLKRWFDYCDKQFVPTKLVVGKELHSTPASDERSWHFHAYLAFPTKRNIKDCHYFDVTLDGKTYHGEYKAGDVRAKIWFVAYCKKDGDWLEKEEAAPDLGLVPLGKRKQVWDDYNWEKGLKQRMSLKEIVYPIKLTVGYITYEMNKPIASEKKRSWWIKAAPNAGKTYWINKQFEGQRVYMVSRGKYPFELYNDEEIIIMDDFTLSFDMIANILNVWTLPMHVAGDVRYVSKEWKLNSVRNIIVLSNKCIDEIYTKNKDAMLARFVYIDLGTNKLVNE